MKIEVNVYHHLCEGAGTDRVLAAIHDLNRKLDTKMTELTDALAALTADVTAENTQIDSALALIAGIPAVVSAAVTDALAAANVDSAAALAAAQAADTAVRGETDKLIAALSPPAP